MFTYKQIKKADLENGEARGGIVSALGWRGPMQNAYKDPDK